MPSPEELERMQKSMLHGTPWERGEKEQADARASAADFQRRFAEAYAQVSEAEAKQVRTPYISIDLETTGLDPDTCQIVEIGAVIEDWVSPIEDLKRFHCYVVYDRYVGEPYALSMHATIFRRIAERKRDINKDFVFCRPEDVSHKFNGWLLDNGFDLNRAFTPAGKNFSGFDRQFLKRLPGFDQIKMRHRAIDPGNLFWNPDTDTELPSSEACLKRSGLYGDVSHTAIEDAIDVIREVRWWYSGRQLRCPNAA